MTDITKWVVVPVDPTDRMFSYVLTRAQNAYSNFADYYNAFLAARPTGPDVPVLIDPKELERLRKQDERMQFVSNNHMCVVELLVERKGYRSTATDALREVWDEHIGWADAHDPDNTEYETYMEALDAAIERRRGE